MKAHSIALAAVAAALVLVSPVLAQDGEGAVFAPYPARIRVGTRGTEVVVTWEDSSDVSAGYAVYRHSEFPDASNFSRAVLLGNVDTGATGFVYAPPDDKPYYYFVLGRIPGGSAPGGSAPGASAAGASDSSGSVSGDASSAAATEYRLFIPLRNVPIEPISVSPALAASAPESPLAATKPGLTGILARTDGDAIVVSVDARGDIGRLVVYRGTSPIRSSGSLLDAAIAAIIAPDSGPYRDYPVPGVEYFYAVIPEGDLISGKISLEMGVNATIEPASVQAGSYRVGLPTSGMTSRSMPLPYLVLTRGFQDAKPVGVEDPTPRSRTLSAETEKAIASLSASAGSTTRAQLPRITIFPEDLQSGGGGEEYALRSIVSGYFAKGSYAEAARQFTLYLSLPRSASNAARARFYRGQAQAMAGAYREAFFDMLQTQDSYYIESSAWIDYILEELRRR